MPTDKKFFNLTDLLLIQELHARKKQLLSKQAIISYNMLNVCTQLCVVETFIFKAP